MKLLEDSPANPDEASQPPMSLSRRFLSLPQELTGCSLPPKVSGRRLGSVNLCVTHILESAVASKPLPSVSLVRVRWWGEDQPGSLFRPSLLSDGARVNETGESDDTPHRAIAMRYPICVAPENLLEYFQDMKELRLAVIDRSTRRNGLESDLLQLSNSSYNDLESDLVLSSISVERPDRDHDGLELLLKHSVPKTVFKTQTHSPRPQKPVRKRRNVDLRASELLSWSGAIRGIVKLQSLVRGAIYRIRFGLRQLYPITGSGLKAKKDVAASTAEAVNGDDGARRSMDKVAIDSGCESSVLSGLEPQKDVAASTAEAVNGDDGARRSMDKVAIDSGCESSVLSGLEPQKDVAASTAEAVNGDDGARRSMDKVAIDSGCESSVLSGLEPQKDVAASTAEAVNGDD
ncbi:hypothetical protein BBJ29_009900, partial [Phytophthora kernoviae]